MPLNENTSHSAVPSPSSTEYGADWEAGLQALTWLYSLQEDPTQWPLTTSSQRVRDWLENPELQAGEGQPLRKVIEEAIEWMEQGMCNVSHPRYFGYISPRPHPATILGDLVGSAANQTPGAWRAGPAATAVEVQVLCWFRELFDLPPPKGRLPGGVFTGGGTLANVLALKLSRDQAYGEDAINQGLYDRPGRVYMSKEGHFSIEKAADLIGLGKANVVRVPVDRMGAIQVDALREIMDKDVRGGLRPLCVVATAGTTASGAIDDLQAMASLARAYNAWFHVDAASGLAMAALKDVRRAMNGLESADSITFDPCKWMFAPFGVGCLLVRKGELLADAFWSGGHYWEEHGELDTFKMNIYGTRQFRSLGLWCYLRHMGFEGYRSHLRGIQHCANALRTLLREDSRFELLPQQEHMPIVCFRVATDTPLSCGITEQLVHWCQTQNIAYPTVLKWNEVSYARVAISNYASTPDDMVAVKHELERGLEVINSAK